MKLIEKTWIQIEELIGGKKFIVAIFTIFIATLIAGTIIEYKNGPEYANRVIYKNWSFLFLQFLIYLALFFSFTKNASFRKQSWGPCLSIFGLLAIGSGSFITWYSGVHGRILLHKNSPNRQIFLPEDEVTIHYKKERKLVHHSLPSTVIPTNINKSIDKIKLSQYLPFGKEIIVWKKNTNKKSSASYRLYNNYFSETIYLSSNPQSPKFKSIHNMRMLTVHYLPETMKDCFTKKDDSGLILTNRISNACFTPSEMDLVVTKTIDKKTKLTFNLDEREITFLPETSPYPFDKNSNIIPDAIFRIFQIKNFANSPHLFLFGKHLSYYDKRLKKWIHKHFDQYNAAIPLPPMGINIELLRHGTSFLPKKEISFTPPKQENGEIINGNIRAIELIIDKLSHWLTLGGQTTLILEGKPITISLNKKSLFLPFELVLDDLKVEKEKGSRSPSNIKPKLRIFTSKGSEKATLSQNRPLIRDGFSFRLHSYTKKSQTVPAIVLSVTRDPGRNIKYLGSLMFLLGLIIHLKGRSLPSK